MQGGALLWTCVLLCALRGSLAFPTGAPQSACKDMLPQHRGAAAQASPSPYSLNMTYSDSVMDNNDRVKLNMEINNNKYFKGILLQAHQVGSDQPIGTFFTNDDKNIKVLTCGDGSNNAVTHANKEKKTSFEVEWQPDDDFKGEVQFVATILQELTTFWASVKSATFSIPQITTTKGSTEVTTTVSTTNAPTSAKTTDSTTTPGNTTEKSTPTTDSTATTGNTTEKSTSTTISSSKTSEKTTESTINATTVSTTGPSTSATTSKPTTTHGSAPGVSALSSLVFLALGLLALLTNYIS